MIDPQKTRQPITALDDDIAFYQEMRAKGYSEAQAIALVNDPGAYVGEPIENND